MPDVVVIGSGLPELAAALEFAEVGLSVVVVHPDSDTDPGRGIRVSPPAHARGDDDRPLRDPEGAIEGFLAQVAAPLSDPASAGIAPSEGSPAPAAPQGALADASPVPSAPGAVLLRGAAGSWCPQPTPALLGIPAVPLSSRALAILGGGGATRAFLDRVKPVLTIGKTHALGRLVRSRLGDAALERLVDPFVRARYGVGPDDVEVAIAAPGLNEALTRAGALTGAVLALSERSVARETRIAPDGGWTAFGDALLERLGWYGVAVAEGPVTGVSRTGDGWRVETGGSGLEARAIVLGADGVPGSDPRADALLDALVSEADETDEAEEAGEAAPDGERREEDAVGTAAVGTAAVTRVRAHASFPIDAPALPAVDDDEAPGAGQPVAVQTVELPGGDSWSVEIARSRSGSWWAHAAGPVRDPHAAGDAAAMRDARAAVAAADIALRSGEPERVEYRVAPFATAEDRDAAARELAELRERARSLLVVGAALHGDDLGAALADSRLAAVHLRRRLTGIAD